MGNLCRRASFDAGATFDIDVCRSREALANLVFQNNQLAAGGCYNTTWTIAVQMQFYLLVPLALLLLRLPKRGFRWSFTPLHANTEQMLNSKLPAASTTQGNCNTYGSALIGLCK